MLTATELSVLASSAATDQLIPPLTAMDVEAMVFDRRQTNVMSGLKGVPEVAACRAKVARNLRDCRKVSTKMARVARDGLKAECHRRGLFVF